MPPRFRRDVEQVGEYSWLHCSSHRFPARATEHTARRVVPHAMGGVAQASRRIGRFRMGRRGQIENRWAGATSPPGRVLCDLDHQFVVVLKAELQDASTAR